MASWEITRQKSLALIGNASAHKIEEETAPRAEAFSIRRLEGSRWRLRRMRSAMGFECHFGTHSTRVDAEVCESHSPSHLRSRSYTGWFSRAMAAGFCT